MAGKRDQNLLAVRELSKEQRKDVVDSLRIANADFIELLKFQNDKNGEKLYSKQFFTRLRKTAKRAGLSEVAYLGRVLRKKK